MSMTTPSVTEIKKAHRRGDYVQIEWVNDAGQTVTTGGYTSSPFIQQLVAKARTDGHL